MSCGTSRKLLFGGALASAGLVAGAAHAQIATGPSSAADGFLEVNPDAYGSWSSVTFGGSGDTFNPAGAVGAGEVVFTTGLMLFSGTDRALLSANFGWELILTTLSSLTKAPGAITFSDTNGDSVDDTATSSFTVSGGGAGLNLSFSLVQKVSSDGSGVSIMRQTYEITNNGGSTATFSMVRALDADLPWDGAPSDFWLNDEVGTTMHGAGAGVYVFQQEVGDSSGAMTLSSPEATNYYAGKNGVDPLGAGLPFGYGTDVQVWDAYGIPANWVDFVAGVGAGVNGVSGSNPPGADASADAFIGLGFDLSIAAGATETITIFHTYGQASPPAPDCPCLADLTGTTCGTNTNDFFAFLGFYQAMAPQADFSPGGGININDFFAFLSAYQADINNPDCPG